MDFISLDDLSFSQMRSILDKSHNFKKDPFHQTLSNQTWGLIFSKSSTRTRVSFEVGISQLGGKSLYLNYNMLQLGRGETVSDTARVLDRYLDGIIIRTYDQNDLVEFSNHARMPVINGLTDLEHPCQIMADLQTIEEKFSKLDGLTLGYFGDGANNICRSLIQGTAKMGMKMIVASPEKYRPDLDLIKKYQAVSSYHDEFLQLTDQAEDAAKECDVIYTDVWISMGQDDETEQRIHDLKSFQITTNLLNLAKKDVVFMHCLPAHRDYEVTHDVIEDRRSIIFDQAENRLHAQKAVLDTLSNERKKRNQ